MKNSPNNLRIDEKKKPTFFRFELVLLGFFSPFIYFVIVVHVFICPCLIVWWQRRSVGEWVTTPPSCSLPWSPPWSWFSSFSPCIYPTGNHRNPKYNTYSQQSLSRKCLSCPWRKLDRRPLRFLCSLCVDLDNYTQVVLCNFMQLHC